MTKEELIEWIKGCIEYSVDEYNTQTNINNKAEAFGFLEEFEKENERLKKRLSDIELLCYSDGSDGEVLSEIMKYFTKE